MLNVRAHDVVGHLTHFFFFQNCLAVDKSYSKNPVRFSSSNGGVAASEGINFLFNTAKNKMNFV
jgi:hypothetical protein